MRANQIAESWSTLTTSSGAMIDQAALVKNSAPFAQALLIMIPQLIPVMGASPSRYSPTIAYVAPVIAKMKWIMR